MPLEFHPISRVNVYGLIIFFYCTSSDCAKIRASHSSKFSWRFFELLNLCLRLTADWPTSLEKVANIDVQNTATHPQMFSQEHVAGIS